MSVARKPQGPRITAKRYDAIAAALRESDDIEAIAERFDLGKGVVTRLRGTIRRHGG